MSVPLALRMHAIILSLLGPLMDYREAGQDYLEMREELVHRQGGGRRLPFGRDSELSDLNSLLTGIYVFATSFLIGCQVAIAFLLDEGGDVWRFSLAVASLPCGAFAAQALIHGVFNQVRLRGTRNPDWEGTLTELGGLFWVLTCGLAVGSFLLVGGA